MANPKIQINHPFALRLVNGLGAALDTCRLPSIHLDASTILTRAERKTKQPFDDLQARSGLEVLVNALNSESRLNLFGRFAIRNMLKRSAESRLQVERAIATKPKICNQSVQNPVFIIGMPRSGTTILHALLHLDRNHRAPLCWECLLPYPAPRAQDYDRGDRLDTIRNEFERIFRLVPDFRKKHYMEADSPQECIAITALNFTSFQYLSVACAPSYHDWFARADQARNLRWHRRFLQFLQSGGVSTNRWLLKSPVHLMRLNDVFEIYPDANVIVTHRNPAEVVPSTASLISSMRSLYSDEEDTKRTGQEQLVIWADYLDRFLRDRDHLKKEEQVLDIHFDQFKHDQMRVVDMIYEYFGWTLHDKDRSRMEQFLRDQPRGKHGVHEYSLQEFGTKQDAIEKRFKRYLTFLEGLDARSEQEFQA